jgi:hypothetical protein
MLIATLAVFLCWQPFSLQAGTMRTGNAFVVDVADRAEEKPPSSNDSASYDSMLPIVVGLGAIVGVVGFNVLALGLEALPGGLAYGAGATVPAEMSVAMSRVYAVTSAVIGGWVANNLYSQP